MEKLGKRIKQNFKNAGSNFLKANLRFVKNHKNLRKFLLNQQLQMAILGVFFAVVLFIMLITIMLK